MSERKAKTTGNRSRSKDHVDAPASKRKTYPSANATYELNDTILCKGSDGYYREAKIIKVNSDGYTVHFHGWNKRYDKSITNKNVPEHFKRYTEEAAKEAKDALKRALESEKQAKSQTKVAKSNLNSTSSQSEARKSSPVQTRTLKSNSQDERIKNVNSGLKDMFDDLMTKELSRILCEEHDCIKNSKMIPKMTGNSNSIEHIFKEFLKTKGFEISSTLEASLKDSKIPEASNYGLYKRIIFFIHLFNEHFMEALVYDEEKEMCARLEKEYLAGDKDVRYKRFSQWLGFTHILRFIFHLPKFLMTIEKLNIDARVLEMPNSAYAAKELCEYLEDNISVYYNKEDYYELNV